MSGSKHRSRADETYWVADVRRWNDAGVEEYGEEFDNGVEVEEHDDLLASYTRVSAGFPVARSEMNAPTAVYLLRMWKIMIAVIIMATMCTKHVAVLQ